jgi:hypothetical protein
MGIRTVSARVGGTKPLPQETVVKISRPSLLQNDVRLVYEHERDKCISEHETRLDEQYETNWAIRKELNSLADRVEVGEDIALMCWCAPKRCHGDNIIRKVMKIIDERRKRKVRRHIEEEEC